MDVLDPGHVFALAELDSPGTGPGWRQILRFVKRDKPAAKYPGNVGHHAGTTIQEVLRALRARFLYLEKQIPHEANRDCLDHLTFMLWDLEGRAHERHGSTLELRIAENPETIWDEPVCLTCGHVRCTWCKR